MKTLNWSGDGNQGQFAFRGKIIVNYRPALSCHSNIIGCLIAKDMLDKHEPHNQKAGAKTNKPGGNSGIYLNRCEGKWLPAAHRAAKVNKRLMSCRRPKVISASLEPNDVLGNQNDQNSVNTNEASLWNI